MIAVLAVLFVATIVVLTGLWKASQNFSTNLLGY